MNTEQYWTSVKLKSYLTILERIDYLEMEREELKQKMIGLNAQNLDGMPKAPGFSRSDRIERIMDRINEIDGQIADELEALQYERKKLIEAVESVDDPTLRRLLQLRYLERDENGTMNTWERICVKMNYSWAQIHRLHKKALTAVKKAENGTQ